MQSSSTTLGVIIALGAQGLIPQEAGIVLVFGANIGTTITALHAAIDVVEAADCLESGEDLVDEDVIPLHLRHVERDARVAAGS